MIGRVSDGETTVVADAGREARQGQRAESEKWKTKAQGTLDETIVM